MDGAEHFQQHVERQLQVIKDELQYLRGEVESDLKARHVETRQVVDRLRGDADSLAKDKLAKVDLDRACAEMQQSHQAVSDGLRNEVSQLQISNQRLSRELSTITQQLEHKFSDVRAQTDKKHDDLHGELGRFHTQLEDSQRLLHKQVKTEMDRHETHVRESEVQVDQRVHSLDQKLREQIDAIRTLIESETAERERAMQQVRREDEKHLLKVTQLEDRMDQEAQTRDRHHRETHSKLASENEDREQSLQLLRQELSRVGTDHHRRHSELADLMSDVSTTERRAREQLKTEAHSLVSMHKIELGESIAHLQRKHESMHKDLRSELQFQHDEHATKHGQLEALVHEHKTGHVEALQALAAQHHAEHSERITDLHGHIKVELDAAKADHQNQHEQSAAKMQAGLQAVEDKFFSHMKEEAEKLSAKQESMLRHTQELASTLQRLDEQINKKTSEHQDALQFGLQSVEDSLRLHVEAESAKHTANHEALSRHAQELSGCFQQMEGTFNDHKGEHQENLQSGLQSLEEQFRAHLRDQTEKHTDSHDLLLRHTQELFSSVQKMEVVVASHKDEHGEALQDGLRGVHDKFHGLVQAELEKHTANHESRMTQFHESLSDHRLAVDKNAEEITQKHSTQAEQLSQLCEDVDTLKREVARQTLETDGLKSGLETLLEEMHSMEASFLNHADTMKTSLDERHNMLETNMQSAQSAWLEAHDVHRQIVEKNLDVLQNGIDEHKTDFHKSLAAHKAEISAAHDEHREFHGKGLQDLQESLREELEALRSDHSSNRTTLLADLERLKGDLDCHGSGHEEHKAAVQKDLQIIEASLREELTSHGQNHSQLSEQQREHHELLLARMEAMESSLEQHKGDSDAFAAEHAEGRADMLATLTTMINDHKDDHDSRHGQVLKDMIALRGELQQDLLSHASGQNSLFEDHKGEFARHIHQLRGELEDFQTKHGAHKQELDETLARVDEQLSAHKEVHSKHVAQSMAEVQQQLQEELGLVKQEHTDAHQNLHGSLEEKLTSIVAQMNDHKGLFASHEDRAAGFVDELEALRQQMQEDMSSHFTASHQRHAAATLDAINKLELQMKESMQQQHSNVRSMLDDHKETADSHQNWSVSQLEVLEAKVHERLQCMEADHSSRHDDARAKLEEQLRLLQDGIDSQLQREQFARENITAQVEAKLQTHATADRAIAAGETAMDVIKDVEAALREEIARLHDQFGGHKENHQNLLDRYNALCMDHSTAAADLKVQLEERLKIELEQHTGSLQDHKDTHAEQLRLVESNIREEIERLRGDHDARHEEQNAARLASLQDLDAALREQFESHTQSHSAKVDSLNDMFETHQQEILHHKEFHSQQLESTHRDVVQQFQGVVQSHSQQHADHLQDLRDQIGNLRAEHSSTIELLQEGHRKSLEDIKVSHEDNHGKLLINVDDLSTKLKSIESGQMDVLQNVKQDWKSLHGDHLERVQKDFRSTEATLKEMIERHADAHGHLRDALADHKTWVVQQIRQEERMREEHREQLHNNVQDIFENTNKRFQQEIDRVYDHQQRDLSALVERVDSHRSDVDSLFCAETLAREQLHDRVSSRIDKAKEETADELARQVARQDAQLRDSRQTLSEQKHSFLQDLATERAARADDRKAVDQHFEKLRADRQKDITHMSATQAGTVDNFRSLLEQIKEDQRALETRLKMIMGDIRGEFMRDCSDLRSSIAEVQQTNHAEHGDDVKRTEFDQETQRLWEALDTHTHNIDEDKKVQPASINHSPAHMFESVRSVPLRKHPSLPVPEVAIVNHMMTPPTTPAVATTPIATAIFPTVVSPQLCPKKPLERSPGIVVRNASTVGSVGIKAGSVPAPMPPAIHLLSGSPVSEPLPCSSRAQ